MSQSDGTTKVAEALANGNQGSYTLLVAEFLEYVRRRKAALRKELEELEVAERVFMQARADEPVEPSNLSGWEVDHVLPSNVARIVGPRTVKQMVIQLLDEEYPAGLTALEILDRIKKRWKSNLDRTTLSPQLTRLKKQDSIRNDKTRWFLAVKETGAPDEPSAPA